MYISRIEDDQSFSRLLFRKQFLSAASLNFIAVIKPGNHSVVLVASHM